MAGSAAAAPGLYPVTVIYTNISGEPSAEVPGLPGVYFEPGTTTEHFDRVFGSPNGNWVLSAFTDLPISENEILLVNHVVRAREGTIATWTTGETVGPIDRKLGINDSGEYLFATNTEGGPPDADEVMVTGLGVNQIVVAREGDPTNLLALPGTTWGAMIDSGVIAADGSVGLVSVPVGGLPVTEDEVLVFNNGVRAQEGVTIPAGQIGNEFWKNFDPDDYWQSVDGSNWLVQGELTGSPITNGVVAVNNNVVVQEGVILAGSTFTTPVVDDGIVGVHMDPAGNWYVRGFNQTTGLDWVYRNSNVIARQGDPIFAGATEKWVDSDPQKTFYLHVGNGNGDYVIGGFTDANFRTNSVLVLNNTLEVAREGDAIDLDGNGQFDDDVYFETFGNDDAWLTDDGYLYVVATLEDGADNRVGQGFFVIDLTGVINQFAGISTSADMSAMGVYGEDLVFQITVTNTGSLTDTYAVAVGSARWTTDVSTSSLGPLAPNDNGMVEVTVTVGNGPDDSVEITFTSTFDSNVNAVVTLNSSTNLTYLPVVLSKP